SGAVARRPDFPTPSPFSEARSRAVASRLPPASRIASASARPKPREHPVTSHVRAILFPFSLSAPRGEGRRGCRMLTGPKLGRRHVSRCEIPLTPPFAPIRFARGERFCVPTGRLLLGE